MHHHKDMFCDNCKVYRYWRQKNNNTVDNAGAKLLEKPLDDIDVAPNDSNVSVMSIDKDIVAKKPSAY